MKVRIKKVGVVEIKNTGVEFQVRDNNDTLRGDCCVTKTGLLWCRGRTTRRHGISISWDDFIGWAEQQ